MFETYWRTLEGPEYEREHRFHETRRWRFDMAWPDVRVAVELNGGGLVRGRHHREDGSAADAEKMNSAQYMGWQVFVYTTTMLSGAPGFHLQQLKDHILCLREKERAACYHWTQGATYDD